MDTAKYRKVLEENLLYSAYCIVLQFICTSYIFKYVQNLCQKGMTWDWWKRNRVTLEALLENIWEEARCGENSRPVEGETVTFLKHLSRHQHITRISPVYTNPPAAAQERHWQADEPKPVSLSLLWEGFDREKWVLRGKKKRMTHLKKCTDRKKSDRCEKVYT